MLSIDISMIETDFIDFNNFAKLLLHNLCAEI